MKKFFFLFLFFIIRTALRLRYSITFNGIENLTPERLHKGSGILFLPNHPSQLDGIMTMWAINKFHPRPAAIEYLYQIPGVRFLLNAVNAIPIPNIDMCSNSLKRSRVEKVLDIIIQKLKEKENFLFYPAGRLKLTGVEIIGGSSGLHKILQEAPETNVVLVRVNGLWGSSFSRALIGKPPPIGKTLLKNFKHILKNFIFFTPRRKVSIEFFPNPKNFPYDGSRLVINQYLEDFYNKPEEGSKRDSYGEPLTRVSYSIWKEELPNLPTPQEEEEKIDLNKIPSNIKDDIFHEIANLSNKNPADLTPETHLASDLALDSLDATELLIFLEDQYGITGLYPSDLTTIAKVMSIAARQTIIAHEEEEEKACDKWESPEKRPPLEIPKGKTIQETFLLSCERMKKFYACADNTSGSLTYFQFKLRTLLLAEKFKNIEGKNIGVLLPSTIAANVVIFALLLAGKIPVMINWTIGFRHLSHVIEISKIQRIISSWKFLDKMENVDLGDIDEMLLSLENIRDKITPLDKLKAFFLSTKKTAKIIKYFSLDSLEENHTAAMLFTSGTETLPKGVPLTHHNILSNLRSAMKSIPLSSDHIAFGILPPFHSFGFCITGLFPLLSGLKIAYSPDPTNSVVLAQGLEKWKITLFCSAPSFLNSLLKVATPKQLKSVRLFVTGAEKTPEELFERVSSYEEKKEIIEGYGITECAPILTINQPGTPHSGVGQAIDCVELLIVHPETLNPLPSGKQGLILARGPNVFNGYFDYDGPSPFVTVLDKTWYNTGDLGFLNEKMFLTISGRLKRFVKIGGEMISLGAIEEALLREASLQNWHLPEDGPAFAVCALEHLGKKAQLILVTRSFLTLRDANNALKKQGLSNLSKISVIRQVEEIVLTGTGKINYRLLQKQISKEWIDV